MPDQHKYTVTIAGQDYDVDSPVELTDVQAYHAAKQQIDTRPPAASSLPMGPLGQPKVKSVIDPTGTAPEPDSYWKGAVKGAVDYSSELESGFKDKFGLGSMARGVTGIPGAIVAAGKGLYGAAKDTGSYILAPEETRASMRAGEAKKALSLPGQAIDAAREGATFPAIHTPQAGEAGGEFAGATGGAAAALGLTPKLPGPIGGAVGSRMERVGKMSRWPMQIGGAHQLIAGNPVAGAAMMLAPDVLQSSGRGLQRAVTAPGTLPASTSEMLLQIEQDLKTKVASPADLQQQVDAAQALLVDQRKTARTESDLTDATKLQRQVNRVDALVKKATATQDTTEMAGLSDAEILQKTYPTIKLDTSTNVPRPPAYQAPRTGAPVTPQAGVPFENPDPADALRRQTLAPPPGGQTAAELGARPASNTDPAVERVLAVNQDQGMVDKTGLEPRSKPSGGYEREIAARIAAENAARRVGPSHAESAAAVRAENPQIDAQAAAAQAASGAPVARTPIPDQVERGGFKLSPTASPPSATDAMTQQFEQRMAGKAAAEGASGPAAREKLIQQYVAKGVPRDQLEKVLDARSKSNITGAHTDPTLVLTPDQLAERKIKLQQSLVSEQEQGHLNAGRVSLAQFEDEIKDLPVDEQLARRAERLRNLRGGR